MCSSLRRREDLCKITSIPTQTDRPSTLNRPHADQPRSMKHGSRVEKSGVTYPTDGQLQKPGPTRDGIIELARTGERTAGPALCRAAFWPQEI